jgi:hypothetical protein
MLKELFEGRNVRTLILGEERTLWSVWDNKQERYILIGKESETKEDAVKDMIQFLGSNSPDKEYVKMKDAPVKSQLGYIKSKGYTLKEVPKGEIEKIKAEYNRNDKKKEKKK